MKKLIAAVAALMFACPAAAAPTGMDGEIFYQIFTRSMRDSNGDRQGDIKGIEQSLPYLKKLGVTSLMLTPVQPSPFYHNYFPDRPEGVDPGFGTMADFRRLASAAHARGMKIYLDEEFQYVAYDHPWFKSALGNPRSRYSDLFFFHGPNNTQPESGPFGITLAPRFPGAATGITTVNIKSARFNAWTADYLKRWVDAGADGFRLDHMMDDLDNKHLLTNLFDTFWKPLFVQLKAKNPKLRFIAEQYDWGYGGDFLRRGGVNAVFDFPLASAIRSFDKGKIVAAIAKTAEAVPPGKHELIFIENHDMPRTASDTAITTEKLRTAATLSLLLKGTPLIYYGQELGMRGKPRDEYKSDERDIGMREAFKWSARDGATGQANWYKGAKTYWMERFARDHDGISVAEEDRDPRSLLNHYRRLLALRKAHLAFVSGSQRILDSTPTVMVVERAVGGQRLLIVANLSDKAADYRVTGRDLLTGRHVAGALHLEAYETRVIRVDA